MIDGDGRNVEAELKDFLNITYRLKGLLLPVFVFDSVGEDVAIQGKEEDDWSLALEDEFETLEKVEAVEGAALRMIDSGNE